MTLTLHIRELILSCFFFFSSCSLTLHVLVISATVHTGGVVPYISITGLDVLCMLNIYVDYRCVGESLKTISTWASACKETALASLLLELELSHWTQIGLQDWVSAISMKQHLVRSVQNGGIPFKGSFMFSLRNAKYHIHDSDYSHALSVVAALSEDSEPGLYRADCRRYHGDTLVV